MWIVAKMKKNQINILQESIKKKIGSESELYVPKIQITKMIKGKLLNKESKFGKAAPFVIIITSFIPNLIKVERG